jgi:ArsR family metal-binding transcriptional regulator
MCADADALICGYALEVATPDCFPTATLWRATVRFEDDITEALPYLNASLKNGDYYLGAQTLVWEDEGRRYSFNSREIVIAPVEDRAEAQAVADRIVGMVNDVWSRRHQIEPSFEGRRPPPNTLDIYKLLPRTNCKECGCPTCMAFASNIREGKAELAQCPGLWEPSFAESREKLLRLFE